MGTNECDRVSIKLYLQTPKFGFPIIFTCQEILLIFLTKTMGKPFLVSRPDKNRQRPELGLQVIVYQQLCGV